MIFSILAFVTLIISICITERKKALIVQSINYLFEALYAFVINAYTGAILGMINFIRSFFFLNKEKFNETSYLFLLFIFESIIIINCIFTWNGYISLLPTTGSIIRTYCIWQTNMKLYRISIILSSILFGLYYAYYDGWIMVLGNLLLLITGIYAMWKNDMKKEER